MISCAHSSRNHSKVRSSMRTQNHWSKSKQLSQEATLCLVCDEFEGQRKNESHTFCIWSTLNTSTGILEWSLKEGSSRKSERLCRKHHNIRGMPLGSHLNKYRKICNSNTSSKVEISQSSYDLPRQWSLECAVNRHLNYESSQALIAGSKYEKTLHKECS